LEKALLYPIFRNRIRDEVYQEDNKKMNVRLIGTALIFFLIGTGVGLGVGSVLLKPINPYEFAIVFATGGLGDKSFNDGCFEGAQKAAADFNITFTWVEPADVAEFEPFLRHFAMHPEWLTPYKLIIGIGFTQKNRNGNCRSPVSRTEICHR
jgi:basic membrane lipoprotein Med (substrate-binding protein (PBP1-ABC) superfamily)